MDQRSEDQRKVEKKVERKDNKCQPPTRKINSV